ncbi:MAG: sensor histidine kinase, partial [Actinomycetota bacterium]
MKVSLGDRLFSGAVVLVMTAVLLTLAVLQYRWSNQVSRATSERMEVDLETTLMRLRDDFYRDIAGFSFQLQINPAAGPEERQKQYARQYQEWARKATYPSVIANVFVMRQDSKLGPGVVRLDKATSTFHPATLPSRFTRLEQHLTEISAELEVAARRLQSTEELRRDAERSPAGDDVARQFPVMIDQDIPALAQAVYHHPAGRGPSSQPTEIDWMIVELNSAVINEQIFPKLVHQHFGSTAKSTYLLAVVRGKESQHAIYASDPEFPGKLGAEADEDIRLFGPPFGPALRGSDMILLPAYHTQTPDGRFHETNDLASAWPVRIEPIHYTPDDDDWQMLARHRKGSLEAAVADMKRRNLAMSFAVLILLGGSMLMLLVSSRRAQTLARLQMDFVTAVSHELRTPLTVISSAADNISDGVVGNQERMEQYGWAIKKAAQQLIHLVEQILMYAATSNNRHRYNLAPVTVAEIVDTACANTEC